MREWFEGPVGLLLKLLCPTEMRSRFAAVAYLTLIGLIYQGAALADVLLYTSDPVAVETGSWRVQVKRLDQGEKCFDSSTLCYFTWLDVQNNSDQSLRCDLSLTVTTVFGTAPVQKTNISIQPRDADPAIEVNEASAVTAYSYSCIPGEPPADFANQQPYEPPPISAEPAAPTTDPGRVFFSGLPGYVRVGNPLGSSSDYQACIYLSEISNTRTTASEELSLQAFLTPQPGEDTGYTMLSGKLGVLSASKKFSFPESEYCADFKTYPPDGTYYWSVLLSEGTPDGYVDRHTYSQSVTFQFEEIFRSGVAPQQIGIQSPTSVSVTSGNTTFKVKGIWNRSVTDRNLSLVLYAVEAPGATQGQKLADVSLGMLISGQGMKDVNEVALTNDNVRPGTYYLTLLLVDDTGTTHQRMDLTGTVTKPAASQPEPPVDTPSAQSGGGGGIDLIALLVLGAFALLVLVRRRINGPAQSPTQRRALLSGDRRP